jgi:hypothetical protein
VRLLPPLSPTVADVEDGLERLGSALAG